MLSENLIFICRDSLRAQKWVKLVSAPKQLPVTAWGADTLTVAEGCALRNSNSPLANQPNYWVLSRIPSNNPHTLALSVLCLCVLRKTNFQKITIRTNSNARNYPMLDWSPSCVALSNLSPTLFLPYSNAASLTELRHQLITLCLKNNRAPLLTTQGRWLFRLIAGFITHNRLQKIAIAIKPATLWNSVNFGWVKVQTFVFQQGKK